MPRFPILRRGLELMAAALLVLLSAPPSAVAGTFSQESFGGRTYWLYVPTGHSPSTATPLVMMLHGCTQTGDGFATSTGMNAVADTLGFLVAYPQQPSSANSSQCWNWFEPAHQSRGGGEPAWLASVVDDVDSVHAVDPSKVFVAGFSAGGGMAVILGATYPDVFTAIGVHSGLEYKAATSLGSAFTAMFSGGPPADPQGQLAFNAMGPRARVVPVMVVHGTSDFTVATVNGDLVLSQWAQTNDLADDGVDQDSIDDVPESTLGVQVPGGRTYTRSSYEDAGGGVVMEKIQVDGMGHNWSGGVLGGTFTDPDGPDASQLLADFFLGAGPAVDTTPPTTTASPSGGTFGSSVTVTLTADEPATTYFTLDGTTPDTASSVYAAPLQISVDTTLRFFSIDVAGNAESVRSAVFVIGGGGDTTPPTTTASPPGGSYGGPVSVTLSADEAATTYYTLDGSVPTTGSPVYGAPLAVTSDAVLSFFSVDAAGNVEGIRSETYTFPATSTVALPSIGAEDGYVGQLWADGFSTGVHRAGDKGFFNTDTYRLILSFDASGLPAGATVTGATLTIHRASLTGTVSQLTADVVADGFGAGPALVRGDYSAPADLVGAFTVSVPATDGASTSTPLPAAALPFVTGDRFQVRLRATAPIGFASDVLTLFGGESSSPPVLEVTYE